jgi:hypothetical protein
LHPAAIEQYRTDVERPAALAAEHSDFVESAELIEALRRLVAGVITHAEPYSRSFNVEVQGRLAQLTNSDLFPSRSQGGGISGSGRALPPFPTRPKSAIFSPIVRLNQRNLSRDRFKSGHATPDCCDWLNKKFLGSLHEQIRPCVPNVNSSRKDQ